MVFPLYRTNWKLWQTRVLKRKKWTQGTRLVFPLRYKLFYPSAFSKCLQLAISHFFHSGGRMKSSLKSFRKPNISVIYSCILVSVCMLWKRVGINRSGVFSCIHWIYIFKLTFGFVLMIIRYVLLVIHSYTVCPWEFPKYVDPPPPEFFDSSRYPVLLLNFVKFYCSYSNLFVTIAGRRY